MISQNFQGERVLGALEQIETNMKGEMETLPQKVLHLVGSTEDRNLFTYVFA